MKTEELMLDDWVSDDGEFVQVTPYMLSCMDLGIDSCDIIKPIPLTQEILEKNGFKNGNFFGELLIDGFLIQCDCGNVRIKTDDKEILDIPCEYVHLLQHALRLCGIEKEIILRKQKN